MQLRLALTRRNHPILPQPPKHWGYKHAPHTWIPFFLLSDMNSSWLVWWSG